MICFPRQFGPLGISQKAIRMKCFVFSLPNIPLTIRSIMNFDLSEKITEIHCPWSMLFCPWKSLVLHFCLSYSFFFGQWVSRPHSKSHLCTVRELKLTLQTFSNWTFKLRELAWRLLRDIRFKYRSWDFVVTLFLLDPALLWTSPISRSNLSTLKTVDWLQLIFLAISGVEYPSLAQATATTFFLS